ncbi:Bro-N domain-containing protein [Mesorhizobium sp.]|uniref:BRO-N domain-containing protein n=1 Tax=Mesorhizobium sp. TaxID=1871066 RepID=UPI000FE6D5F7|nr:Bro-N domain-containing protein [Mesorhizobium sp.]RWE90105.1 MAG: hypothetical protein EOS68_31415 [Mesorhizobium sp.]
MNNPIQNFAFEEHLVRVIDKNGEPWFAGKDVCAALDIQKHHQALDSLDLDERGTCSVGTPGGQQSMVVISEPGVYRLVFRSRKPEAERFKRWLAHEVLPAIRKTGSYGTAPADPAYAEIDIRQAPLAAKVEMLRYVARVRGREASVAYMKVLGLPELPMLLPAADDEPVNCLRFLLDHRPADGADSIRRLLEKAFGGHQQAEAMLGRHGIRLMKSREREGFFVASSMPEARAIFAASEWHSGSWIKALRRLPGAESVGTLSFNGWPSRSTFLPAGLLDG